MAGGVDKVEITLIAIDKATNIITGIASSLTNTLGKAAVAVGAMMTAALGASVVVLKDLVDNAGDAQDSMARFNALVSASPLSDFKDQMIQMANALSLTTKFEDDNILEAEAMLATYQTLGKEVFPQALNATLDLAEFMKTDATQAAETLGRSFADIPGGSLTMLYRQKLLTQSQKDMAESMAKSGKAAEAQAFVLDILNNKIGTLAEDMAGTFKGKMEVFKNSITAIKEELGGKLLPLLTPVLDKFQEMAIKYLPILSAAFDQYVVPAVKQAVDAFTKMLDILGSGNPLEGFINMFQGVDISGKMVAFTNAFKDWARSVDWKSVSDDIAAGIDSIDWAGIGQTVRTMSADMWKGISYAVSEIDWLGIGQSIAMGMNNMLAGLTGQGSAQNVIDTWVNNIVASFEISARITAKIAGWQAATSAGIAGWILSVRGAIINFQSQMTSAIFGALSGVVPMIGAAINLWRAPIQNTLHTFGNVFYSATALWVQRAISGITDAAAGLVNAITNLMSTLRALMKPLSISITLPNFDMLGAALSAGINGLMGGSKPKKGQPMNVPNASHAKGTKGWETVPNGFSDDSYIVGLTSGERYAVMPNGGGGGSSGGATMGSGLVINLTYAPAFSTANKQELLQNITPILNDWYRRRLTS